MLMSVMGMFRLFGGIRRFWLRLRLRFRFRFGHGFAVIRRRLIRSQIGRLFRRVVAAGWRVFQNGETFASRVDGQRSPSDSGVATAFDDHDSLQFLRVLQNSPVEGELFAHLLLPVLGVVDNTRVLDGRLFGAVGAVPAHFTKALLARSGSGVHVDALAVATTAFVVGAFVFVLAPMSVVERVAATSACDVFAVSHAILAVLGSGNDVDIGTAPESVIAAPLGSLADEPHGAVAAFEIFGQLDLVPLGRRIARYKVGITAQHQNGFLLLVENFNLVAAPVRITQVPGHVER